MRRPRTRARHLTDIASLGHLDGCVFWMAAHRRHPGGSWARQGSLGDASATEAPYPGAHYRDGGPHEPLFV